MSDCDELCHIFLILQRRACGSERSEVALHAIVELLVGGKETMKVTLKADEANARHTHFTVFVNGANCGRLCMLTDEAIAFYMILQAGCHPKLDQFLGQGHWEEKPNSALCVKTDSEERKGSKSKGE